MRELRRNVAFWIFGGGFIGSLISLLYPVIRFRESPGRFRSVGQRGSGRERHTSFRPNSGKIVKFGTQPVLLIHVHGYPIGAPSPLFLLHLWGLPRPV